METVNITLKINKHEISSFESWLGNNLEIISFKILPDTTKMYNNNDSFKKLVKIEKEAKRVKEIYINNNIHKYQ